MNQRDQLLSEIYQNVSQGWSGQSAPQPAGAAASNLWPANQSHYFNQYDIYDERRQNTHMMSQHYPQYWQSPDYGSQGP